MSDTDQNGSIAFVTNEIAQIGVGLLLIHFFQRVLRVRMCVCVCVCVYVCEYVCVYVCVCVFVFQSNWIVTKLTDIN